MGCFRVVCESLNEGLGTSGVGDQRGHLLESVLEGIGGVITNALLSIQVEMSMLKNT